MLTRKFEIDGLLKNTTRMHLVRSLRIHGNIWWVVCWTWSILPADRGSGFITPRDIFSFELLFAEFLFQCNSVERYWKANNNWISFDYNFKFKYKYLMPFYILYYNEIVIQNYITYLILTKSNKNPLVSFLIFIMYV